MKISVIVPVYNAEKYLEKCLNSILDQTYSNLEIILVNDGSTDESGYLCEEFASKDERVIYISQHNIGVEVTRKRGVSVATGDYVTFVDADDFLDSDAYEIIVRSMSESCADIIAFDVIEEDIFSSKKLCNILKDGMYSDTDMVSVVYPQMLSSSSFFTFGILPSMYSKMFRRDFLIGIDIVTDKRISFGEDAAFVFQALAFAKSLQVLKYSGYHYTKKLSDSLTWKPQNEEMICRLKDVMETGFRRADILNIMNNQLLEYITFVRLLKAPQTVPNVSAFFKNKNRRIALYGAGGFGQALFHEYEKQIELWVDRDYEKYSFLGGKVKSVEELMYRANEYDVIYIAIINELLCEEIKEFLQKKGIKKEIHYFGIKDYKGE